MITDLIAQQTRFFETQQTKDIAFRLKKLRALRHEIQHREKDISVAIHQDFRKSEFEVLSSEIAMVLAELNLTIKKLKTWAKPQRVFPSMANFPSAAKIYKQAYGKVLIISPWNYPFNLAMIPLVGAIAAGNTVVLKPSEYSAYTSQIIREIIEKVFDSEHVAVVDGDAKVAQALLTEKWNYIFFTGSVAVGKIIYRAAAENLTPVTLELGGKSPTIIDRTADLRLAAKRIVWGKFINAGQTCIAPDYVLIDENIMDEFIGFLKSEIVLAYGENPKMSKDYARIISKGNFNRLQSMFENMDVVVGGKTDENDNYIAPSIIRNPDLDSLVMEDEIFGPILPVLPYQNLGEAEQILKRYPNPLAFYVFSTDTKIQKYFIEKFSFGGGVLNDTIVHFINDRLPFGGVGDSGIGHYHGKYSFNTFTHQKSVVKRYNWLDIPIRYLPSSQFKKKLIKFFLS